MAQAPETRAIVRVVVIVVVAALVLALLWMLREPISWVLLAVFVATALSGPVNFLNRWMQRGFAIFLVLVGLVLVPVGLAAVVVPPVVGGLSDLVNKAPEYAHQTRDYVQQNGTLRGIEKKYQVSTKLENKAEQLPNALGNAAGTLADIGGSIAGSLAALTTILVMSVFMLAGGSRWVDWIVRQQPPAQAKRIRKVLDQSTKAIGNYISGAVGVATLAGLLSFLVMSLLDVPFAAPLAVMVGLFSLVPMIGATLAGVIVGVVTLFVDFPMTTLLWAGWMIFYQQIENNLIQPQIQRRSVNIHPLVVIIAVIFGSKLLGVLGAILAIPLAATVQIVIREWWTYRQQPRRRPAAVR